MEQQGGDFMKMTPGEQEGVDVQHFPRAGEEHQHKSVVGKVKDKAKKLTSKIKGVGKKKRKDEHGNEYEGSSSSSEDEGEVHELQGTREPSSGAGNKGGAVHGGVGYGGTPFSTADTHSPDIHHATRGFAGLNIGEAHGHEDPVAPASGAAWGSSVNEPRAATNVPFSSEETTEETTKRQNEVPASLGQESAGISSDLQSSHLGARGEKKYPDSSSVAAGALTGKKSEEKIPEGIMKPTGQSGHHEDTEMKPLVDGVDSSGRDMVSSHVVKSGGEGWTSGSTKPVSERASEGLTSAKDAVLGATGTAAGALGLGHLAGTEQAHDSPSYDEAASKDVNGAQKGWMQRASESVVSVKNAISSKLSSPRASETSTTNTLEEKSLPEFTVGATGSNQEGKTWTEKAKDATYSVMPSSTQPKDVPHDSAPHDPSQTAEKPGITTRAAETATAMKDTVAAKLGYGQQQQHTVVSDEKSAPSVTEKVLGTVTGAKDAVASKLGYGAETESKGAHDTQTGNKMFTPDEHDTALSQKITDMLSLGSGNKDVGTKTTASPAATTPTSASEEQQGKGYMDRVSGVVGSLLGKKEDKPMTTATGTTDPNPAARDAALH